MSVIKKTTGRGFLYARTVNVAQAEISRRVRHAGWILVPRATISNLEAFLDALEMRRDFFFSKTSNRCPAGFCLPSCWVTFPSHPSHHTEVYTQQANRDELNQGFPTQTLLI
jgi:hypothetical protein